MERRTVKSITQSLIKTRYLECYRCPKAVKDRCIVFKTESEETITQVRRNGSANHPLSFGCIKERLKVLAEEFKVLHNVRIKG